MNTIQRCILAIGFIMLMTTSLLSQVHHTVTFSPATEVTFLKQQGDDNVSYDKLSIHGAYYVQTEGDPELPSKLIRLLIPANQDVNQIIVTNERTVEQEKKYTIYPSQPMVPLSQDFKKPKFVNPNKSIYESDDCYPKQSARIVHQGYLDGNKHIVTIAFCPFKYYPKSGRLLIITSADIELRLTMGKMKALNCKKPSSKKQSLINSILKRTVENPEMIKSYSSSAMQMPSSLSKAATGSILATGIPAYEYVIITTSQLQPYFADFIKWKKKKGINIGVVTTDQIYAKYPSGDVIYPDHAIHDKPGSIRQYLYEAYQEGTVYALLAGDYTDEGVPVRYGCAMNNATTNQMQLITKPNDVSIPTDLYYSDFNGDWNVDNDHFYGEVDYFYGTGDEDAPDYNPEIFVGRIICKNGQEVLNWTDKILSYEINPGNGNSTYLSKALWVEGPNIETPGTNNINLDSVKQIYPTSILHTIKTCTESNRLDPSQVVQEMSNNYGMVNIYCHGNRTAFLVAPEKYSCVWTEDDYSGDTMAAATMGQGLNNMTNTNKYFIVYSISCYNASYDEAYTATWPYKGRSIAEGFTTMFPYQGGPAFLGNTRAGVLIHNNDPGSMHLHEEFAKLIAQGTQDPESGQSFYHLGVAEAVSKQNYIDKFLEYSHNLIGCPETELWTETPSPMNNVTITDNGYSLNVNSGISGSTITVCSDDQVQYYSSVSNVSSYTFSTSIRPLNITIIKHNYLPYTTVAPAPPPSPPPPPPTLVSPANIATNVSLLPTLTWSTSSGATGYRLQVIVVIQNSMFIIFDTCTSATSMQVGPLGNNGTYYWRVSAKNDGGSSEWSQEVRAFTTVLLPPLAPTLTSPLNGASNVSISPQLIWNASATAASYHLQISPSQSFNEIVLDNATITDTSIHSNPLAINTTYYWRVNATNISGTSVWSAANMFTTSTILIPTLTSPVNGTRDVPLTTTLRWNAVSGATSYTVQWARNIYFTDAADSNVTTSPEFSLSNLMRSTYYLWRVRASNAIDNNDWSHPYGFFTIPNPPPAPTLVGPLDEETYVSLTPTLSWSWDQLSNAILSCRVQVSKDTLFTVKVLDDSLVTSFSRTLDSLEYLKTYYWRAKGTNTGGAGDWSARQFFVTVPPPPPLSVSLISPQDQLFCISADSVVLSWNPSAGTTKYLVQWGFSGYNTDTTTSTTFVLRGLRNSATYYWHIIASNDGGWSEWSEERTFSTEPAAPTLTDPANGSINRPTACLNFSWTTTSGSTNHIQLSTDSLFRSIVIETDIYTDENTITYAPWTYSPYSGYTVGPPELLRSMKYYWRVNSDNDYGESKWSHVWSFVTEAPPPLAPNRVSPLNLSTELPRNFTFVWNKSLDATQYGIEVCNDSSFNYYAYPHFVFPLAINGIVDTTVAVNGLDSNKTYYWRVHARNSNNSNYNNAYGPWSTVWSFKTVSPPTIALNPTSLNVGYTSGSSSFTISNIGGGILNWNVASSDISWLTVNPASGTNSGTVIVNYNTNTGSTTRTGTITVTATGATNTPQTLTLIQAVSPPPAISGPIASNTTWNGSVYVVGNVTVNSGVTLIISPSTVVTFDSSVSLIVKGTLNAQGDSTSHILFDGQNRTHSTSQTALVQFVESGGGMMSYTDSRNTDYLLTCSTAGNVTIGNSTYTFSGATGGFFASIINGSSLDTPLQDDSVSDPKKNVKSRGTDEPQKMDKDVVAATKVKIVVPDHFEIKQNYPNPFNPATSIQYQLHVESSVELIVYDMLGRRIRTLINTRQGIGYYNIVWDGRDDNNNSIASGIYLYHFSALPIDRPQEKHIISTKKMILIR